MRPTVTVLRRRKGVEKWKVKQKIFQSEVQKARKEYYAFFTIGAGVAELSNELLNNRFGRGPDRRLPVSCLFRGYAEDSDEAVPHNRLIVAASVKKMIGRALEEAAYTKVGENLKLSYSKGLHRKPHPTGLLQECRSSDHLHEIIRHPRFREEIARSMVETLQDIAATLPRVLKKWDADLSDLKIDPSAVEVLEGVRKRCGIRVKDLGDAAPIYRVLIRGETLSVLSRFLRPPEELGTTAEGVVVFA
jgi:hypothetical protein